MKPILFFIYYGSMGNDCSTVIDGTPLPYRVQRYDVGTAASVAYLQPFLKHFFVEPALGVAFDFYSQNHDLYEGWKFYGPNPIAKLNLGIRF